MKTLYSSAGIATLVSCAALLPLHAYGDRSGSGMHIETAVEYYSNIAVVRIASGNVLKVPGFAEPCGFLYRGEVYRDIKGRIGSPEVLVLSSGGFSIRGKYLIFLSNTQFRNFWSGHQKRVYDHYHGRLKATGPYYGPRGKDWLEACVALVQAQESKVFLSWFGTSLRYTMHNQRPLESWLAIDLGRISLWSIYDDLDVQADIISMALDRRDDYKLILGRRALISEESIIDWILKATKSNGRSDVQPPTAEVESTAEVQDRQ